MTLEKVRSYDSDVEYDDYEDDYDQDYDED